jgi:hypothetical protein
MSAFVDELEMGGDGGFQGKAAEEGLGEGVDGADAHASGQVEDAGEEGAGACQGFGVGFHGEGLEGAGEGGVGHGDPAAEGGLQADGHLGRRGLGERQALDAVGAGAGEHEAKQAVGEELGLPGAGRGGDEGGHRGVGGRELAGVGAGDGGVSHGRARHAIVAPEIVSYWKRRGRPHYRWFAGSRPAAGGGAEVWEGIWIGLGSVSLG